MGIGALYDCEYAFVHEYVCSESSDKFLLRIAGDFLPRSGTCIKSINMSSGHFLLDVMRAGSGSVVTSNLLESCCQFHKRQARAMPTVKINVIRSPRRHPGLQ